MDISSAYTITAVDFNDDADTQGSKLTVVNPTTDKTYTCRVENTGQQDIDTTGNLDVYGTFFNVEIVYRTSSLKKISAD